MSLAALLLMSAAVSSGGVARAEPATAFISKTAPDDAPYADFVREAAQRFGVPASWIGAVMTIESGGDVRALSPKGAMGLMQVMPETWAGLRVRHGLGDDPYDPRDNIRAGAAYLRELHERYGSPGFLAAYNAGPGRYDEHLATGRALPYETQLYLATLAPLIEERQADDIVTASRRTVPWQEAPLFVTRDEENSALTPSVPKTTTERPSRGRSAESLSRLEARTDSLFARNGSAMRLP
ncbi:lytic transglycosylase domain-containing protein [Reyranella sp.]|uniref:lytic transglycosylase domain-containing protein n=1 Tax=Reyranella sp. TaxID=1929291 RepID=UPI0040372F5E